MIINSAPSLASALTKHEDVNLAKCCCGKVLNPERASLQSAIRSDVFGLPVNSLVFFIFPPVDCKVTAVPLAFVT